MRRTLLAILIACTLAPAAAGQWPDPSAGCVTGQCPMVVAPASPPPAASFPQYAPLPAAARAATVRIVNAGSTSRAMGTGTLVEADQQGGLVVTCAHLFREEAGSIRVVFPDGRSFDAQLAKIDAAADLAALWIDAPGVRPVAVARRYPQRGDPLVSCGYGTDGRLWCNRGQALGYVATAGSRGTETLELSGAARFGDSGGPVFDRNYQLVAVLFGTNGRVVDGTFCGRVRRFLDGLSARFRARQPALPPTPPMQPPTLPGPVDESDGPLIDVPQTPGEPNTPPIESPPVQSDGNGGRIAKLESLVSRLHDAWQGLNTKIDRVADALRGIKQVAPGAKGDSPRVPPEIELPPGLDRLGPVADAAKPWLSAKLAAVLVSFGVPGGIAGLAAGAIVYFGMRRGKRRLQEQIARLQARLGGSAEAGAPADQHVVRHHNRYVPYEVTVLDKAWALAHARIGEKYPGAVPYLKMAEGVKDQMLSGNDDPTISEGRYS